MGIRLWGHISFKALIRYDKHIFLDIPWTFREENKDMAQTEKLMGFQKGFKIYKTSVQAGNFVCCVLEGVSKKKEKKKMFLMVDSEIDMQMVDSENE